MNESVDNPNRECRSVVSPKSANSELSFGFYVCALSLTFERITYYVAKWGIGVFVVLEAAYGGLGLSAEIGALLSSQFVIWTYITPVIGGFIADRWVSPHFLIPIGEFMTCLGYLIAARAHSLSGMILMLVLVSIGTGLFRCNISGVNGRQFAAGDLTILNKAFSIQYVFVSFGSFCGSLLLTLIAARGGTDMCRNIFLICALIMFADAVWWIIGQRFTDDAAMYPFRTGSRSEACNSAHIGFTETTSTDCFAGDYEHSGYNLDKRAALSEIDKKRTSAILLITLFAAVFYIIWYILYLPVYYNFCPVSQGGMGWVDWRIGSFEVPVSWFDSINGAFCIIGCLTIVAVGAKMAARSQGDWSMWKKTSVGIIILGLCAFCMMIGAVMCRQGEGEPAGIWIIFLISFLMAAGEIIFLPLGNAFITQCAPGQLLGTLLGLWPMMVLLARSAYEPLYRWLGKFSFAKSYGIISVLILACGIIMLAFDRKFETLVEVSSK